MESLRMKCCWNALVIVFCFILFCCFLLRSHIFAAATVFVVVAVVLLRYQGKSIMQSCWKVVWKNGTCPQGKSTWSIKIHLKWHGWICMYRLYVYYCAMYKFNNAATNEKRPNSTFILPSLQYLLYVLRFVHPSIHSSVCPSIYPPNPFIHFIHPSIFIEFVFYFARAALFFKFIFSEVASNFFIHLQKERERERKKGDVLARIHIYCDCYTYSRFFSAD